MKLVYRIALHLCWALPLVLGTWAVLFYFSIVGEINDEVDDMLDNYSEQLIRRALTDGELPESAPMGRNGYLLQDVSANYADSYSHIRYSDEQVRISGDDEEPARVLKTIFRDKDGRYRELTVMTPTIEKEDMQKAILHWVIWLYGSLLLAVLIVNLLVLGRTLRPLYALLRWLDSYTVGRTNAPLANDTRITEFRRLNDAAQRAAERNEYLFERQKQFIGNASHEMQTPLAVCRNRLEMLVGDGTELTETQLAEVGQVQQTLDHLVRLNRSLLLLSKIDNGQFPESEEVDFGAVVRNAANDLSEIYAGRGISLKIVENGALNVLMNPSLATSLAGNLIKNAFVHSKPGATVEITISAGVLTICNSGNAGPLDSQHLFERFYQGAKKEGSTGLGLSVVDAICRLYAYRIEYTYINSLHCFTVDFSKKR